jgi:hypothetical protein
MPALSFKKQFIGRIARGEKSQTIRAERKRPFKKGDRLFLYTAMRTKQCQKLGEADCLKVAEIEISQKGEVAVEKMRLSEDQKNHFAVDDGFNTAEEMVAWFRKTHGLPFKGQLILWNNFTSQKQ